ncbi:MAG: antibiotic biosynthesis monooxygenase [Actinobacteria bacterium]|nr:antibiotic biosynthesis monooxygenase [Actinomycetota bacterium]
MIAISRFRVPGDGSAFRAGADAVVAQFASSPGSLGAELVQNLDDPELWAIVSRWADVGSYRRAFSGTEAKLVLIPLLSLAIDEPSAFAEPSSVGENRPRGTLS